MHCAVPALSTAPRYQSRPMQNFQRILKTTDDIIEKLQSSRACCSGCNSHQLNLLNSDVRQLCKILDAALSLGLIYIIDGYWPPIRQFIPRTVADEILKVWKPKSLKAKGSCWLYFVLNEGTVHCYFQSFLADHAAFSKYYRQGALMRNPEVLFAMSTILSQLSDMQISLDPAHLMLPPNQCLRRTSNSKLSITSPLTSPLDKQNIIAEEAVIACETSSSINNNEIAENTYLVQSTGSDDNNLLNSQEVTVHRKHPIKRSVVSALNSAATISRRCSSVSSQASVLNDSFDSASFEQQVADVSAELLKGVNGKQSCDLLTNKNLLRSKPNTVLLNAEVGQEATENAYSFSQSILGHRGLTIIKRKTKPRQRPTNLDLCNVNDVSRSKPQLICGNVQYLDDCSFSSSNSVSSPVGSAVGPFSSTPVFDLKQDIITEPDCSSVIPTDHFVINERETREVERPGPEATSADCAPESTVSGVDGTHCLSNSNIQIKNDTLPSNADIFPGAVSVDNEGLSSLVESISFEEVQAQNVSSNPLSLSSPNGAPSEYNKIFLQRMRKVNNKMPTAVSILSEISDTNEDVAAEEDERPAELRRVSTQDDHDVVEEALETMSVAKVSCDNDNMEDEDEFDENENLKSSDHFSSVSVDCRSNESELRLEGRTVVDIGIHVFLNEGEKLYKAFKVHTDFTMGNPSVRMLILTNFAMYVVSKQFYSEVSEFSYKTEAVIHFHDLNYITKGVSLELCTGDELLTRSILSSLELAIHREGLQATNIFTDTEHEAIVLEHWASAETRSTRAECSISMYSLVFWTDVSNCVRGFSPARNGYLFWRQFNPSVWQWSEPSWNKSYFVLRGKKLYQFNDSTCKFGEKIIDIREEVAGCRKVQVKDYAHCIELVMLNDECCQLVCPTQHDFEQWFQSFMYSLSQSNMEECAEAVACGVLLTKTHVLLCQQNASIGFVRTLAWTALREINAVAAVESSSSLILDIDHRSDSAGVWILTFSCTSEMNKLKDAISKICPNLTMNSAVENDIDGNLQTKSSDICKLWSSEHFS